PPPRPPPPAPPQASAAEDEAPERQVRRRRRPMPAVARFGLHLFGAVGLSAAFLAVQGYDALNRYDSRVQKAEVRYVAQGMTVKLQNAEWKVIGFARSPQQDPETPDRLMLQIELEGTAINDDGKYYTTSPPGFLLTDTRGRSWLALPSKTPKEMLPGIPGRFTLLSAVPTELADQVELELWTNQRQALERTGPALHFDR
ncbi:hypothetical protein, partial [Sphaerisporangium aureirubrum]|uniref:hypothetical protein n=1 Tax=Sphaerisporangium aureirubrum TaxID=1544736 RepID=UPI003642A6AC